MNKFLAQQLREFNKETGDVYRESWGSILNFVHEDPSRTTQKEDVSVDVF